ncbi:MAG: DUF624 domain-containing protein [Chloroflexota bacterium]|nr:DUF624 domain-containing protein [Chloroflexota bacterium]
MAWTTLSLSLRLFFRRLGIFLVGNILWLLLSLLLVTWPAATGGLFYLAHRVVREERDLDPHYARVADFWTGFRRYGLQSTIVVLLDLGVLIILATALRFYLNSPVEPLRWLIGPIFVVLATWLGMQVYLFPLLITSAEQGIVTVVRRAFLTAISYPLDTLLLLLSLFLLSVACLALAGPVLLLLFALLALIQTMALRMIRIERSEISPQSNRNKVK